MTRLHRRIANEDGFAMVAAIAVMSIALVLTGVVTVQAISSGKTTMRDTRYKRAGQAADAALATAINRINQIDVTHASQPCIAVDPTTGALGLGPRDGTQWCPAVSGQVGGGASYSYQVSPLQPPSPGQTTLDYTIVSTGTADGAVTRRVAARVSALAGTPLFGDNAIVSLDDLVLNASSKVQPNPPATKANVRSGGNITLNASASVCGDATSGTGTYTFNASSGLCAGGTKQPAAPTQLSPIDQGNASTVNDNSRICGADTCTGNVTWVAATRKLTLNASATINLSGNVYSFCQLTLNASSTVNIAPRTPGTAVRIYFDSPENCGGVTSPLTFNAASKITNPNNDPVSLQIYVLGSATTKTTVNLNASSNASTGAPLVIYAPNSEVTLAASSAVYGAIAAKKVTLNASSKIVYSSTVSSLMTSALTTLFRREQYRECTPVAGAATAPDDGC